MTLFSRPIVTAAALALMAPDEVDPWQAFIVTDAAPRGGLRALRARQAHVPGACAMSSAIVARLIYHMLLAT